MDSSDLLSYLVLQTSFATVKQFKAHKSMEAYNQFVCGWVKDVKAWNVSGKSVVTGKVSIQGTLKLIRSVHIYRCDIRSVSVKLHLAAG